MPSNVYNSVAFIDSNNREIFINPIKLHKDLNNIKYSVLKIESIDNSSDYNTVIDELYINGDVARIGKEYTIHSDDVNDHYHCIYAKELSNHEIEYRVDCYNDQYVKQMFDIGKLIVSNEPVQNGTYLFEKNGVVMTDTNSSFLVLRTNPKLTGNIKLVVDQDENLYLDTFKVFNNLSKFAYRHKSVSSESNYSTDVRNIFKNVVSEDLYGVPTIDLKAHDPYTDFALQYDTTYSYGAETNDDEMYNENFRILAPLWINRVLPDFFVVFKVDGPFNLNTYYNIQNDRDVFNTFLKECKLIKCFDMRISSPLGKYLNNHYNSISRYPGSVLLQFKEQETGDTTVSGTNSWIGISVDTGLVVKKDEDSYFACKTIEKGSQDKLNQFIIDGFERNRVLCPNLINLEFMFNDDTSEPYEMNRYFGLYLKENDFVSYDYIETTIDQKTRNYLIKKYDENHVEVDDKVVSSSSSILNNSQYRNRLVFAVGPKSVERVTTPGELNDYLKREISNIPYKNFQSCHVTDVNTGYKNFVTLKFKKQIRYGEHFRIVIPDFSSEGVSSPIVFEIIASNDKRLANEVNGISPYISVINAENNITDYIYYREVEIREGQDDAIFKNTPTEYPSEQPPTFSELGKSGTIESTKDLEELKQSYYFRSINGQTFKEFSIRHIVKYETAFGVINNLKGIDTEYYRRGTDAGTIETTKYPFIFRLNFYTQDLYDETIPASLDTQIDRLSKCIDAFSNLYTLNIKTYTHSQDSVSIVTTYQDPYFQHITADILNNDYVEIESCKIDLGKEVTSKLGTFELYDMEYTKTPEENDLIIDDTISYYNNERLGIKLYPLNNSSEEFSGYAMMFAPINFELLGWRKSSIIKMAALRGEIYEIDSADIDKIIPNTIVNTTKGFYRLLDFNITSLGFNTTSLIDEIDENTKNDYQKKLEEDEEVYRNRIALLDDKDSGYTIDDVEKIYREMIELRSFLEYIKKPQKNYVYTRTKSIYKESIYLQSPFNLDKFIIASNYEIVIRRNMVDLYKPAPVSISLMGILPVKDFESRIGYISKKSISNKVYIDVPKNTTIYIDDSTADYSIKRNVYYTLKTGKLKGLPLPEGSSFVIIGNNLYHGTTKILIESLSDNSIVTSNDAVRLETITPKYKVSYNIENPVLQDSKYYKNDDIENDLAYSLLVPTVCMWKGNGMYYDQNSVLTMKGLSDNRLKISEGYMSTYFPYSISDESNMFITSSLDSLVKTHDGNLITFRDFILNSSITDTINVFLTEGSKPMYTIGYYNRNINTLEFILYGIKYSISFNTNEFVKEIQLSNYNKYEIYVLNHFTGDKNEMIINTIENIILIINHNFNLKKFEDKKNIFNVDSNKFNFKCISEYNWTSTDKNLNFNDTEFDRENIYIPIDNNGSIPEDVKSENFYQMNFFDNNDFVYSKGDNYFVNMKAPDLSGTYVKMASNQNVLSSLNSYDSSIQSGPFKYSNEFISTKKSYLINPSYDSSNYIDSSINEYDKEILMKNEYIDSLSEDNMIIYVKKSEGSSVAVSTIETSENYTPIKITASYPENIKYNIDFYNPQFIDMIDFDLNENEELIKSTKSNFLLSNTSFKDIHKIEKYYGYKIFNSLNHKLYGKNGSMFVNDEYSLVSSNWDSGYYRSYSSANKYKNIDGYVLGIEDKTFFGSKCINLRNINLTLGEWASTGVRVIDGNVDTFGNEKLDKSIENSKTFIFNMTQSFYEFFRNTDIPEFVSNWSAFNNTKNCINNYIKKTLVNYFKINKTNLFKLYCKPSDGRDILLSMPEDFDNFEEVTNFESEYYSENDDIILTIRVTDLTKTYYATYDLKSNIS